MTEGMAFEPFGPELGMVCLVVCNRQPAKGDEVGRGKLKSDHSQPQWCI